MSKHEDSAQVGSDNPARSVVRQLTITEFADGRINVMAAPMTRLERRNMLSQATAICQRDDSPHTV